MMILSKLLISSWFLFYCRALKVAQAKLRQATTAQQEVGVPHAYLSNKYNKKNLH
jgi:hypothetical protein